MQQGILQSGPKALQARWKPPTVLRCAPGLGRNCRRLRAFNANYTDHIVLPSAPPLRDDVSAVERLPHQRSVGLEASTSAVQFAAAPPQPSSRQQTYGLDLGSLLQPKYTFLLGGLLGGLGVDSSKPGSVLQAITVLAVIVAVHEAGHFLAAKLQGIRVTRFAVGFGPTLFKYQGGDVEYCLNAIPLGGYVAFPDDDPSALAAPAPDSTAAAPAPSGQGAGKGPESGAASASASVSASTAAPAPSGAAEPAAAGAAAIRPDDPDLLKNRPIPQRALVISAGVIANILFAYLVLLAQISTVGKAETAFLPGVRVVLPDTPAAAASAAARAGLRTGDVILRIGDVTIPANPSQVSASVAAIRSSPGRELDLVVQRGGAAAGDGATVAAASSSSGSSSSVTEQAESGSASGGALPAAASSSGEVLTLRCTPDAGSDGQGRIGVQLTSNTYILHTYPASTAEVLAMTQSEFNRLAGTVFSGLKQIVTNFAAMSGQLSGPVAIVAAGSEVVRMDSAGLFQFAAIVNINLAAVNILPLPALDGGYLLLLGLEAVRGGRKLPAGVEQGVMAGGFLLLTALGLGLVIRDTLNLL